MPLFLPESLRPAPPPPPPVEDDVPEGADAFSLRVYKFLKKEVPYSDARSLWFAGQRIHDMGMRCKFYAELVMEFDKRRRGEPTDLKALKDLALYKWQPVGVEEFVTGEYYLNKKTEIYPKVLAELIEMNSGKYVECVLTGGIGSAKTTCALYITAYQLYLLSCMHSPHRVFGLDPASEILVVFQSINKSLAKGVDYMRFKTMIEASQYFKDHFPYDKDLSSQMNFPHRISVAPVSGQETAAIGQNVIGGVIDELNYMSVVEKSKQSADKGATYDQAVALYNSIARRRKSRFMEQGKLPGILCLVSSKKYPGQFTDQKEEEAKTDPTIYIYDKRVWEVKPEGSFTKGWFYVFTGDMSRKPRILMQGETVEDADRKLILAVPMDFLEDFRKDIINALREIGGISTLARFPYFLEVDRVSAAFGSHPSIFEQTAVDFVLTRLTIRKSMFYKPELPRFAHVDLAISGDSAGLVIGCVDRFVNMKMQGFGNSENEYMPHIRIDGSLEIKPPKGAEIQFWKVREVLTALYKLGLNIRWVTFDSFQSKDSMQLLRQQGFVTGDQSMDIVPCKPYDFLKSAMYSGRVSIPTHAHLQHEIVALERDAKTQKIDHIPGGSKDVADSLAGVVYGLTMRREIWSMYNVPVMNVMDSISSQMDKLETKDDVHRRTLREQQESEFNRV